MVLDEALEGRIATILEPLTKRWRNIDPEAVAVGHAQAGDGAVGARA